MAEVEVFCPDGVLDILLEQPPANDSSSIALLQANSCRQLNSPYFEVGVIASTFQVSGWVGGRRFWLIFFC
jgi:hypothetical protein